LIKPRVICKKVYVTEVKKLTKLYDSHKITVKHMLKAKWELKQKVLVKKSQYTKYKNGLLAKMKKGIITRKTF
jgi:hypothetical protein